MKPLTTALSTGLIEAAARRTRTWPSSGSGVGRSRTEPGSPKASKANARIAVLLLGNDGVIERPDGSAGTGAAPRQLQDRRVVQEGQAGRDVRLGSGVGVDLRPAGDPVRHPPGDPVVGREPGGVAARKPGSGQLAQLA